MAGMRKDANLTDFESLAGFEYWTLSSARRPRTRPQNVESVWSSVAGYPEWTSCKECEPSDRRRCSCRSTSSVATDGVKSATGVSIGRPGAIASHSTQKRTWLQHVTNERKTKVVNGI